MDSDRTALPEPVPTEDPAQRRARILFLAVMTLRSVGSAMCYLAATTVVANAGDPSSAGIRTSLFLAVSFLAALWVPWVPSVGRRFGEGRSYAVAMLITGGVAALCAVPVALTGGDAMGAMLILAVAVGAPGALCSVYQPLLVRRLFSGSSLALAHSYQGIAGAIGWIGGSIAGGLLIDLRGSAAVLLIGGLLHAPLVIVALRAARGEVPEPEELAADGRREPALRATIRTLRETEGLRRVTFLVAAVAIFAAPMTSMAVPISLDLRPPSAELIATGSGLLMAAFALGRLLAPLVVRRLERAHDAVAASAAAGLGAGLVLFLFAVASGLQGGTRELVDWGLMGIAFGILFYGNRSLAAGAADRSGEEKARSQAVIVLIAALAGPVGSIAWGWSIDTLGPEAVMVVSGIAVGIVSVALGGHRLFLRRQAQWAGR